MKKCVLLLSGGLDSVTTLAYAKSIGYDVISISFCYGQKHSIEVEFAKYNAEKYNSNHKIINMTDVFSGFDSSLIGLKSVSKDYDLNKNKKIIPKTYVPARNIIFLSIASGYAESLKINEIFIGANAVDYSGYPDCRPEFISSFENTINVGTSFARGNFRIRTPLINMKKSEIIKLGISLGVDYSKTISCYDPVNSTPCGKCDSCRIREEGFKDI